MTQLNITMKEKQIYRHRGQTCSFQWGGGWGKEGLGVWD